MLAIIISLALLYFLVGLYAPEKARPNRSRILAIVISVLALEVVLTRLWSDSLVSALSGTLLSAALVWVALEKWLAIERRAAAKITGLYVGARFVLGVILGVVLAIGGASA